VRCRLGHEKGTPFQRVGDRLMLRGVGYVAVSPPNETVLASSVHEGRSTAVGSIECTPAGTWKARYRDLQGRSRRKHFTDRRDAERFLEAMQVDRRRGLWLDPVPGRMLFSGWVGEWERTVVHLRPSTANRYQRDLHRHVLPRFASMRLCDITPRHVRCQSERCDSFPPRRCTDWRRRCIRKFRTWVYFAGLYRVAAERNGRPAPRRHRPRQRSRIERQVIEVQSHFVECGPLKTAASRRSVTLALDGSHRRAVLACEGIYSRDRLSRHLCVPS
jgi:hypothetical protein